MDDQDIIRRNAHFDSIKMAASDNMKAEMEQGNPLHTMDDDQLLSAMTLADRAQNWDEFSRYRNEILYRMRCAAPLINWWKPIRRER